MRIRFVPMGVAALAGLGHTAPQFERDWAHVPRVGDGIELSEPVDGVHDHHYSGTVISVGWMDGAGGQPEAVVRFR